MALYTQIENAKGELEKMKHNLQYFKNEDRKKQEVLKINSFIVLVNACEQFAAASVDKDVIDVMLLYFFKGEYMKEQNDGREGFVSVDTLNRLRREIAHDLRLGRENVMDALALQMAVDTLENSEDISLEDKVKPLTKDERLLRYVDECKNHWKDQLRKFIDHCHNSKVVWNS